jgi:hypothetical protein
LRSIAMTEKTENTNRYLFVITGFDAELKRI